MRVQCSTNCAIKPTGSWSYCCDLRCLSCLMHSPDIPNAVTALQNFGLRGRLHTASYDKWSIFHHHSMRSEGFCRAPVWIIRLKVVYWESRTQRMGYKIVRCFMQPGPGKVSSCRYTVIGINPCWRSSPLTCDWLSLLSSVSIAMWYTAVGCYPHEHSPVSRNGSLLPPAVRTTKGWALGGCFVESGVGKY